MDAPTTQAEKPSPWWRSGFVAAAIVILGKAKTILAGLKLLSFGKLFLTMGSMFTMIWFEATRSGWPFGVGFVLLILVHELGHGWAIRRAGLDAGYPVFIPFFGAVISLKGQLRSSLEEARIAIAGPVAGAAGAAVCVLLWQLTGARTFLAVASTAFFLNLFNLVPLPPLDGGRVASMFSRRIWVLGGLAMLGLFLVTWSPGLAVIGLLSVMHMLGRARAAPMPDEDTVTDAQRREMAVQYFALAGFLAGGFTLTRQLLA